MVDAAVQTAKATDAVRAAGLINAVLRRYLRERKTLDAEIARNPATRHASPIWLADRLRADWPVRWTQLLAAGDAQAPMWLRVNSRRTTTDGYLEKLREAGIGARARSSGCRGPWCSTAPCDVHELARDLPRAWCPCRTWAPSASRFRWDLARVSGYSTPARRPAGRPRSSRSASPTSPSWWPLDIDPQRLDRVRRIDTGNAECRAHQRRRRRRRQAWWDGVPFDRILLDAPCSALGRDPPASRYPSA